MRLHGQCLCGAIAYEVEQLDGPIVHCHCKTCCHCKTWRKAHASAFASTARVMRENFRWLKGEATVRPYASSPTKNRWFCPLCGSHLMAERPVQPHVILRVATLDEDPRTRPAMHIWTAHKVPWLTAPPGTPHFHETPE
ncbi:MAG TPA: GFA family protein [Rhodopila sp.]|jgi:hypothetical protein|nr:GFA family protein [Rhodopila sp.]